jgi:hypothetical protein
MINVCLNAIYAWEHRSKSEVLMGEASAERGKDREAPIGGGLTQPLIQMYRKCE